MTASPLKPNDFTREIFIPVDKKGEVEKLFQNVASTHTELLAQLESGAPVLLQADSFESGFLFCKTTSLLSEDQRMSFQFKYGGELYFAQFAVLPLTPGLCRLKPPGQVFRLQRRQNYRVRIPKEQGALFIMKSPFHARLPLVDISAGGFLVTAPATTEVKNLIEGSQVCGQIEFGGEHEPLQVDLSLRRKQDSGEAGQMDLGFEVVDPEQLVEMRLISYVMEIYRVFYSHPINRSSSPSEK